MIDNVSTGKSLIVNLIPKIDATQLQQQIQGIFSQMGSMVAGGGGVGFGGGGGGSNGGSGGGGLSGDQFKVIIEELKKISDAISKEKTSVEKVAEEVKQEKNKTAGQGKTAASNNNGGGGDGGGKRKKGKGSDDDDGEDGKDSKATFNAAYKTTMNILGTGINLFKKGFGIVQQIYERVKQSSQFLQTVENMFNLAMSLLLLPFGNALASVILPSMINLVDGVLGLWEEMEEVFDGTSGTLGQIMDIILNKGMEKFSTFFNSLGSQLQANGGLLGSIGSLMNFVGKFLESGIQPTLTLIFNAVQLVLNNFKLFVSIFVAYQTALLGATIGSSIPFIGGAIGGTIGGAVGGLGTYAGLSYLGMADGGYVPATHGGQLRVVGEGGEGEYIIPESKMGSTGSTIVNNFYGYTKEELIQTVKDVLRDEVQSSSYTTGLI